MRLIDVKGWCPMGCGRTLHLNMDTGVIFCISKKCHRPEAVTELIRNPWTKHHTVVFKGTGFEIKHPMSERVTGSLLACTLQRWLNTLDGPPVRFGTYHVTALDGLQFGIEGATVINNWVFEEKTDERF